jgi:hypothetical protein
VPGCDKIAVTTALLPSNETTVPEARASICEIVLA